MNTPRESLESVLSEVDDDYQKIQELNSIEKEEFLLSRNLTREQYSEEGVRIIKVNKDGVFKHVTEIIFKSNFFTFSDSEEIYTYRAGVWTRIEDSVLRNIFYVLLEGRIVPKIINEIIDRIKFINVKRRDKVPETPANKICLKNGVLDTESMNLEAWSPSHYFFSKLPINFKADATCPNIKRSLNLSLPDGEDRIKFFEICGQIISGKNFTKKLFLFEGPTNSGKSVWVDLITSSIGKENATAIPIQDLEKNQDYCRSKINNKALIYFADISDQTLKNLTFIKSITGGDVVSARSIYGKPFDLRYNGNLLYSCNKLPNINEDSDAVWDRLHILFFKTEVPKDERIRRDQLLRKITSKEELSGFFNLCLIGLRDVQQNGFSSSLDREDMRELYRSKSDAVFRFLQECIEYIPEGVVLKKTIYSAYITYCGNNKVVDTLGEKEFNKHFQGLACIGDKKENSGVNRGRWVFTGIRQILQKSLF